jgi:hypothetical protein
MHGSENVKSAVGYMGWFEVIWPIKSTEGAKSAEDIREPMAIEHF